MYEVMNEEGGKMRMSVGNWHIIKDSNWWLIMIRRATINAEQLESPAGENQNEQLQQLQSVRLISCDMSV